MKLGSSPGELTTCLGERCMNREITGLRFCSQGTQPGETAEGGKGLQDREQHMQSSKARTGFRVIFFSCAKSLSLRAGLF